MLRSQKKHFGAQTQRAIENFPIGGIKFKFPFGRSFIKALGAIKYSAASANHDLGLMTAKKASHQSICKDGNGWGC